MNTSEFILNSINNLTQSLLAGVILVFAVTWIFLKRLSASLIVCAAIPFSLVITFIFMGELDYTINIFTLSALAMASGMVVDNCIVSTDQVVYHIEKGARRSVACVVGTAEVQSALVASTLTTVVVLLPLAFIRGLVGVFFSSLTVVMVAAVAASLFVSLTFIPMMGSFFFRREEDRLRLHRFTDAFIGGSKGDTRVCLNGLLKTGKWWFWPPWLSSGSPLPDSGSSAPSFPRIPTREKSPSP